MWNVDYFLQGPKGVFQEPVTPWLSTVWGTGREMPPKSIAQWVVVLFFDLSLFYYYFVLKILIEVELICNVLLVSGVQQSDSVMYLLHRSLHCRVLHNTEYSLPC